MWFYIYGQANHADNKQFKRGQVFTSREEIFQLCHLDLDGIKAKSVSHVIDYLKEATQIATRKATRGMIITVCNYDLYQNLDNYRSDSKRESQSDSKATEKRHRSDTINNNDNNEKKLVTYVTKEVPPKNEVAKEEKKGNTELARIVSHLNSVRGSNETNWGKAGMAWKLMKKAKYSEEDINRTIDLLAKDTFWADRGFDLMTVCNQIPKVLSKTSALIKKDLVACTPQEVWDTAMKLRLYLVEVEKKHEDILKKAQEGTLPLLYKDHTSTLDILVDWLKEDLQKGFLQEWSETEQLYNIDESPQKRAIHEEAMKFAREQGKL